MKADMATQAGAQVQVSLAQFTLYFLKLGCIGFGGPIALVGYMQKDLVDERKWISQEDYLNGLAFSQLAPGPLAAQLAMYLGFVRAGFIGATIVAAAFILPSFLWSWRSASRTSLLAAHASSPRCFTVLALL